MMIKDWGPALMIVLFMTVAGLMFCNSNKIVETTEDGEFKVEYSRGKYTILTDNGECWVVTRDAQGQVTESHYYSSEGTGMCKMWLENHHGDS